MRTRPGEPPEDGGGSSYLCNCSGLDTGRHKPYCPHWRPWWAWIAAKLCDALSMRQPC